MDLVAMIERAMNILAREKTEFNSFPFTISTNDLQNFLLKLFANNMSYWKKIEDKELGAVMIAIEHILSATKNKQRALALFNSNEVLTIVYIKQVFLVEPPRSRNRFNPDFLKLKTEKSIPFFCFPYYYEKLPATIVNTLVRLNKIKIAFEEY